MYIIEYENNKIYAGTYNDLDSYYLYDSNPINRKKPKTFKTFKHAKNHRDNLLNKIPYPSEMNLRIVVWSVEDLKKHLIYIGIDIENEKKQQENKEKEKYWSKIFKPIKGDIEVKRVIVDKNICTVIYMMPYCTYENEFFFQADLDKETVIKSFCEEVKEKGDSMCHTIKEITRDVINSFR